MPTAIWKARLFLCGNRPRQSRPPSSSITPTRGTARAVTMLPRAKTIEAQARIITSRRPSNAEPSATPRSVVSARAITRRCVTSGKIDHDWESQAQATISPNRAAGSQARISRGARHRLRPSVPA